MDAERWRRVERIYHAALERQPNERGALIETLCAGDGQLRSEVAQLIEADAHAGTFMDAPAWQTAAIASSGGPSAPSSVVLTGRQIANYSVLNLLGAGAMGEVYRARDNKLNRDVALKVIPLDYAIDPARRSRFRREAHVLASLNHPNIAAIYGLEETADVHALVLELVDGETLASRIKRGALSVVEALSIARQIAEALEAAHEHGIIHRDLKPANITVRDDGTVKVLDFGLAKVLEPEVAPSDETRAPGGNPDMSAAGLIVGTAAYLAPEQARGKPADRRSDLWSFGCVLFEMLTGRRAFPGRDVGETLAAVTTREPDWQSLPRRTPPGIVRVLRHCLNKDRKDRLGDASAVRLEIADALNARNAGLPTARWAHPRATAITGVAILVVVATLAGTWLWARRTESATVPPEVRFTINTPPSTNRTSLAMSPDGRAIAFTAMSEGRSLLWVRPLDVVTARPFSGTDDAQDPFWSPDGRSLGFFADGKLKRIQVDNGSIQELANAPLARGGAWSHSGVIVFAPTGNSGIVRVSPSVSSSGPFDVSDPAGVVVPVTRLETPRESSHRFPQFLSDGRRFLYYSIGDSEATTGVYVGSLDGEPPRRLLGAESAAVYSPSGHLLFLRQNALYAQRLDPMRLTLIGEPLHVVDRLAADGRLLPALSAAATGAIAFRTGAWSGRRHLTWFDRTGSEKGRVGEPDDGDSFGTALSPDGRRVAMSRSVKNNNDIWLLDADRGVMSRFTSSPSPDTFPVWSPDGTRLAFGSPRTEVNSARDLYWKPVSGDEPEKLLLSTPHYKEPLDWSRDGRLLLYRSLNPDSKYDLWALPMDGDRKPFPVVQSNFDERDGQFSPDSRFIAYQSNESGRWEVYIQSLAGGPRVQVSSAGGAQVRWRRDGRELFYIALDGRLMAVPVRYSPRAGDIDVGAPQPLFVTAVGGAVQAARPQFYAVAADGQRFLMNTLVDDGETSAITIVLNWNPER